jgi:hypothetical protein
LNAYAIKYAAKVSEQAEENAMTSASLEVARFDEVEWTVLGAHRDYNFRVKHLLKGQEDTPDNYRLTFSQADEGGPQSGPKHRHTFDQFRMPLKGRTSIGVDRWLETNEVGYFPESVDYGPTKEIMDAGKQAIILQFGGASGLGYLSTAQTRVAVKELKEIGDFKDGLFHWPKQHPVNPGRIQDAYETVWEHIHQRSIEYPEPRYDGQVVMRPAGFPWQPSKSKLGMSVKPLGSFTERNIGVDFIRIEAGRSATMEAIPNTQVGFIFIGTGSIGGQAVGLHSAFSTAPGVSPEIKGETDMEFVVFRLPHFD